MSRSTTAPWLLVAKREVAVKLRDKSFVLGTLLTLAVLVGVLAFSAWQSERHRDATLVVTGDAQQISDQIRQSAPAIDDKLTVTLEDASDESAARTMLADGDAKGWLHKDGDTYVLTADTEQDSGLQEVVTRSVQQAVLSQNAEAAGTTAAELTKGSQVRTALLDSSGDQAGMGRAVGFIMALLFYFSALMFGMTLASSVVEEKQSRIVEIIATSIPVNQLLLGKILGNVTLAVGQLGLYLAVGLVGITFTDMGAMLPGLSAGIMWFVAFYLAGFVLVATLFAVAGALASRVEDVQSTATPVTMLLMGVFFAGLLATGTVASVLSWIPPFSAVLMPMRLVSGTGEWWQAAIALLLLVLLAAVVLRLATRIYRRALLQTSGKLGYREAWNAEV